jgi:cyclophilin family peptidyl-prolyl cis-trans isomerase
LRESKKWGQRRADIQLCESCASAKARRFFGLFGGYCVKKFLLTGLAVFGFAGMAVAQTVVAQVQPAPAPAADPQNILNLQVSTGGTVRILLRPDVAPNHVERIRTLTRAGFYDGLIFHRVIEGFMAQGGDPQGTGTGGSPLPDLKAEFNGLMHLRGAMSMARSEDENSANSQFFIVFSPSMKLDGKYTVFGRVFAGMEYVDAIERGEPPANPSRIVRAWIDSDGSNATRVPLNVSAPAPSPAETK